MKIQDGTRHHDNHDSFKTISSKFDHAKLIGNLYFGIYGKLKESFLWPYFFYQKELLKI